MSQGMIPRNLLPARRSAENGYLHYALIFNVTGLCNRRKKKKDFSPELAGMISGILSLLPGDQERKQQYNGKDSHKLKEKIQKGLAAGIVEPKVH
jgi:hypothetical protein